MARLRNAACSASRPASALTENSIEGEITELRRALGLVGQPFDDLLARYHRLWHLCTNSDGLSSRIDEYLDRDVGDTTIGLPSQVLRCVAEGELKKVKNRKVSSNARGLKNSPWHLDLVKIWVLFGDPAYKTGWPSERFLAALRDLADIEPDFSKAAARLQTARRKREAHRDEVARVHKRRPRSAPKPFRLEDVRSAIVAWVADDPNTRRLADVPNRRNEGKQQPQQRERVCTEQEAAQQGEQRQSGQLTHHPSSHDAQEEDERPDAGNNDRQPGDARSDGGSEQQQDQHLSPGNREEELANEDQHMMHATTSLRYQGTGTEPTLEWERTPSVSPSHDAYASAVEDMSDVEGISVSNFATEGGGGTILPANFTTEGDRSRSTPSRRSDFTLEIGRPDHAPLLESPSSSSLPDYDLHHGSKGDSSLLSEVTPRFRPPSTLPMHELDHGTEGDSTLLSEHNLTCPSPSILTSARRSKKEGGAPDDQEPGDMIEDVNRGSESNSGDIEAMAKLSSPPLTPIPVVPARFRPASDSATNSSSWFTRIKHQDIATLRGTAEAGRIPKSVSPASAHSGAQMSPDAANSMLAASLHTPRHSGGAAECSNAPPTPEHSISGDSTSPRTLAASLTAEHAISGHVTISQTAEPGTPGNAVDNPLVVDDHNPEPKLGKSSSAKSRRSSAIDHSPRRAFESLQPGRWVTGTAVTELVSLFAPDGTHVVDTGHVRVRNGDDLKRFKAFRNLQPDELSNILAPICHDNRHWTYALIRPRDHVALIYDPLHDSQYMQQSKLAIQQFCDAFPAAFASQNSVTLLLSADGGKQMDGSSCGVLVILDAIMRMTNLPVPSQVDTPLLRHLFSVALAALHPEELAIPDPPQLPALSIEVPHALGNDIDPNNPDSAYHVAYHLAIRKKDAQAYLRHLSIQKSTCASLVSAQALASLDVDESKRQNALARLIREVRTLLAKIAALEVQGRVAVAKLEEQLRSMS